MPHPAVHLASAAFLLLASLPASAIAADDDGSSETPSATEKEDPHASPEVQSQVGLGTEKEEPSGETYDPSSPFTQAESQRRKKSYGHGLQFGLRPGIVFPYKIQFRFDDSPLCDPNQDGMDGDAKTCGLISPAQVELALSFAPTDGVEPFAWARFGLAEEEATGTEAAFLVGAGLRVYTMSESKFKLFFEAAAGAGLEGAIVAADEETRRFGTQLFGRLAFGPQYDFNRYIGLFGSAGPGFAIPRAITMQLEAMAGLQARLP